MKTAIAIPLKKSRKIKINVFLRGSCFQRGCFFVGTEKRRQLPAAGKNLYDVYHLPEIPEGSSCWGFCLGARFHGFLECGNSCLQITVCGIHSILVCSGTIINCFCAIRNCLQSLFLGYCYPFLIRRELTAISRSRCCQQNTAALQESKQFCPINRQNRYGTGCSFLTILCGNGDGCSTGCLGNHFTICIYCCHF